MIGHGGNAVKMLKTLQYKNILETYFVKTVGKWHVSGL